LELENDAPVWIVSTAQLQKQERLMGKKVTSKDKHAAKTFVLSMG